MQKPLQCLLVLVLSGCTTATDDLTDNSASRELSSPAASAIAGDLVSRLAEQVGPGINTIKLNVDASPFGQAMEAALKGWGYAVATDQKIDEKKRQLAVAYAVDYFEGQALVRISAGSIELARAYATSATGASPASPVSVRRN
ncbi:conjugal transfer protein TrbH [Rhizobium leguminosarum]|uniref:conjugal transfer protein TrbH n=1 Tax=Rhizobium leguminosarum TaxID=384 RepID=UPI0010401C87|nr:conjugal transfer protein TrbH [Rhizobium leguminosarum]TBZ41310.1 conjugal transfer protein TrbH [Rhizobium leguminosarum bv. viciae]TCA09432.1 conjugal transfer protein TrbH [Rhizobium leguminosarum bv. viciae]TCA18855.1 conjugal transfer protein TrbH [Rhizobium leguminosarum bv. viciae]